jgi:prepilin-type N-terminal cleavage/methylation domain-containing protein
MKRKAFTLIEVLAAIILIAIAIASLVASNRFFSRTTGAGAQISTAEFLIEQIKELTLPLDVVDPNTETDYFGPEPDETGLADYDDLDDFYNSSFCPPIDAHRVSLTDFSAYSQQITVQNIHPSDFEQTVANHGSNFVRVTVTILMNSEQIASESWIRARY